MANEKKQKHIWNFENVVSEEEQLKRIDTFNDLVAEIGANYYIQNKSSTKK